MGGASFWVAPQYFVSPFATSWCRRRGAGPMPEEFPHFSEDRNERRARVVRTRSEWSISPPIRPQKQTSKASSKSPTPRKSQASHTAASPFVTAPHTNLHIVPQQRRRLIRIQPLRHQYQNPLGPSAFSRPLIPPPKFSKEKNPRQISLLFFFFFTTANARRSQGRPKRLPDP